jgi:putative acetyltransferase
MIIREASESDLEAVLAVERDAFGSDVEANLVRALLADPSAQPSLSLLAFHEEQAVGHILFTKARIEPEAPLSVTLLAPLAVAPDAQKQGVGGELIRAGLQKLAQAGVDLAFVLGYPDYYSRHGFQPAARHGFAPTYPILKENEDAWMVHALRPEVFGPISGRILCANALDRPEYWRE